MGRLVAWYRARGWGTKLLLVGAAGLLGLLGLYVSARAVQYAGASRTPAGLFVPEDADIVVRIADGAGRWRDLQKTELWRNFTRKMQKDAGVRTTLNEVLGSFGAPTLDDLEDHRWLDRNPLLQEDSLIRFAGRDLAIAVTREKFCIATRIGPWDFLLLPGLQLFPGLAGAERAEAVGAPMLRRGKLYFAIQGAIVVVSNDPGTLSSALKRHGTPGVPTGLLRASLKAEPIRGLLRGFPAGGLLAFTDVEKCGRIDIDVEVSGADLVVRASGEGLEPIRPEPAPVDTVRMIPSNGLGAIVTNVDSRSYWDWLRRVTDRRTRGGTPVEQFARDNFGELVEILASNRFAEEVLPKLDGPVSVLFGASQGENGRTYAAAALYLRSSSPREAADSLQGIIDKAVDVKDRDKFRPADSEVGGVRVRSYSYHPDVFGWNNYLCACYAVTGDALILANNLGFLTDALRCLANQDSSMAVQLPYEQAMRRLQQLGLRRVMAAGAAESLFLYGPAIRQGLEGFYSTVASRAIDTPSYRDRLRKELETRAQREGQPLTVKALDDQWKLVIAERIREMEDKLRGRARILDYLKWIAFQVESIPGGMKLEFAVELLK